jgi:hypothetical protein
MNKTLEEKAKDKFLICPESHKIANDRGNYKRDYTGEKDSEGYYRYEQGLHCIACNKVYGLSQLKEKK